MPGGGLDANGGLPPWTLARLDRAAAEAGSPLIITLSAGTVHKPPPLDSSGRPVLESVAAARHLIDCGVPPDRILTETCSFDTIGNAFFARLIHIEPRQLTRLLVVTSDFHSERTEVIFRWVFEQIEPSVIDSLEFDPVDDIGLTRAGRAARRDRERRSTALVRETAAGITTMADLHRWLFTHHAAYAAGAMVEREADPETLGTY